jgi:hypothetical protein
MSDATSIRLTMKSARLSGLNAELDGTQIDKRNKTAALFSSIFF